MADIDADLSRNLQELCATGDLHTVTTGECSYKNLPTAEQVQCVEPTPAETAAISRVTFPKELEFSVSVNLTDSKKAFQILKSGLEKDANFTELLTPCAHDPLAYWNPIGNVDMTIFSQDSTKPREA